MCVSPNFKTKKALKEQLKKNADPAEYHKCIEVFAPGLGTVPKDGTVYLEGPHYPEPHRWYAEGILQNGVLVAVK